MKKIIVFTVFLFSYLLFWLPSFTQSEDDGWKLAKDKEGIKVYTRIPENSKFKEFSTQAVVDADPEKLVEAIIDVDNYTSWMANIKDASMLDMPSEQEFYVYSEIKVPWPFDDRDNITKSIVSYDSLTGSYTIDITMVPEYIPEKKGFIRMIEGNGLWKFTPTEDGKTEIFHRFMGDPAGNIPSWIVNMFIVDGPYKTMIGLGELVEEKD
jgi:ribosome-associated toxin RatA of RatAB toxin-antitoxin module